MNLNYTRDEIEQVVQHHDFPSSFRPPSPSKMLGVRGVDVARDCLELHQEVDRLRGELRERHGIIQQAMEAVSVGGRTYPNRLRPLTTHRAIQLAVEETESAGNAF